MIIKNGNAILGDCIEEMKKIPDGSIDCIITDPPYGNIKNIELDGRIKRQNGMML